MISERDVIYITKKQASLSVAVLATFCLLVFMLGYFWGKQSVLDGFGQRVTQESTQDQADYLVTMQSFAQKVKADLDSDIQEKPASAEPGQETESKIDASEKNEKSSNASQATKNEAPSKVTSSKKYKATLLGFGTKPAALAFVNRLKKHNISVEIKPRVSKSASGKAKRTWYQVVTKSYASKDEVSEMVNKIKKYERIKDSDIKIV